ncbi:MAG: NAD(+)/NADH kinase, partial [archaeon]
MNILLIYHETSSLLEGVKQILDKKKVQFDFVNRQDITPSHYVHKDLVLVVGGDGTFLRASHYNLNVPMLGINPNPETKEGFFMQLDKNNYSLLNNLLGKDLKTIDLLRLQLSINSKKVKELVLNEAFIGDKKPYNMFNYELKIGEKHEFQRSSGVLVGTPAGSTAWIGSAGGKAMKLTDRKFQYLARELYERNHTRNYKMKQNILEETEEIMIKCMTPGIVVIDSISE